MDQQFFILAFLVVLISVDVESHDGDMQRQKRALDDYDYNHQSYHYNAGEDARNGDDDVSDEDEDESDEQDQFERKGYESSDESDEHDVSSKKHKKVKPKVIIVKKIIPLSTTTYATG